MERHDGIWEKEEFEDLVARSLIGLFETKIKPEKKGPKCVRFNEELFYRIRAKGCYFPSNDRIVAHDFNSDNKASKIQRIDPINDGFPDYAYYSSDPTGSTVDNKDYLWTIYAEKVPFMPKPFVKPRDGKVYRITQLFFAEKVSGCGTYVVIDKEGIIESAYIPTTFHDPITGKAITFEHRPRYDAASTGLCEDYYASYASISIQAFQDRKHLWNVQAKEGIAKATFAVHPEQIKSLFYARNLPQSTTGRKRPILHWVNSHHRRIKNGTDVDVDKYLRGIHKFEMNGTEFIITNPMKEVKF